MMDDDGIGGSGYSLAELSDYLERGREPRNAEIESNAECQAVLASLGRLGELSRALVADESAAVDERWFDGIMREVTREVRAGRDIPLGAADERATIVTTEGAIRALLREVSDALPGVIVERTRLTGDVGVAGGEVGVEIAMSVAFGRSLQGAADEVRRIAADALARHTALTVTGVDVTVDSVHGMEAEGGR